VVRILRFFQAKLVRLNFAHQDPTLGDPDDPDDPEKTRRDLKKPEKGPCSKSTFWSKCKEFMNFCHLVSFTA
jgi:hypothetical protein